MSPSSFVLPSRVPAEYAALLAAGESVLHGVSTSGVADVLSKPCSLIWVGMAMFDMLDDDDVRNVSVQHT